ncbi:hypothetical protein N9M17_00330 [bacterium]|jgi:hypothetical protein|nr:hypothetical protein [bacterium]
MAEDVLTPELVDLQDTLSKTDTKIVNDLPSDAKDVVENVDTEIKSAESSGGLTENQKKNLPEALQKAILAKKEGKSAEHEESEPTGPAMDVAAEIPGDEITPAGPETEEPWQAVPEPAEPEVMVPEEPEAFQAPEVSPDQYREIYSAHSMSQRVASMPLAEYEAWLFPDNHSPDYLRGQMCLSRVEASLKAANGGRTVAEPWQIKIGAALWSRLNYNHGDVESTRRELERAPPMEILPLIPRNASEAISVIEEMQSTRDEPTPTPYALIAACGVALIAPLMLLRRR